MQVLPNRMQGLQISAEIFVNRSTHDASIEFTDVSEDNAFCYSAGGRRAALGRAGSHSLRSKPVH
jgi:hypothetical protein